MWGTNRWGHRSTTEDILNIINLFWNSVYLPSPKQIGRCSRLTLITTAARLWIMCLVNKFELMGCFCCCLPDDCEEGVDEEGDALLVFLLQQQQHRMSSRTKTNKIPPAAAPMMIAKLSSSFLPPGRPTCNHGVIWLFFMWIRRCIKKTPQALTFRLQQTK